MLAHHYGMFLFNTADPGRIDAMEGTVPGLDLARAKLGVEQWLR